MFCLGLKDRPYETYNYSKTHFYKEDLYVQKEAFDILIKVSITRTNHLRLFKLSKINNMLKTYHDVHSLEYEFS